MIVLLDYSSAAMNDIIQCKASLPHIQTELKVNEDLHSKTCKPDYETLQKCQEEIEL